MTENEYDNFVEKLDELAESIKSWNKKDAQELCDLLNEFEEICSDLNSEYYLDHDMSTHGIDLVQLPTLEIPESLELYPIWAVDVSDNCVVGSCYKFEVESLNEIKEYYEEQNNGEE